MKKYINKTLNLTLIAVFAVASLNAQPVAEAEDGPVCDQPFEFRGKPHKGDFHRNAAQKLDPGHRLLNLSARLELSDEQELQILKLSQNFRSEMDRNRESAKSAHETLKNMRENKAFDEDTFREAMAVIQPTMLEGMVLRAKYMEELGKVLTEDQKAEVEAMKAKLKQRGKRFFEGSDDRVERWRKHRGQYDQAGL